MHVLEAALFANLVARPRKTPPADLQPEKSAAEPAAVWRSAGFSRRSRIPSGLPAVIGTATHALFNLATWKGAHVLHRVGNGL